MLTSVAFIFLMGLSLGYLTRKIKLPSLIGMLMTGIILGPYALNALYPQLLDISADLRQIALVIILTRAGLALDIKDLKQVGRPAILMSFIPASFEIAGIIIFAPKFLGISILEASIMGTVLAAVSPAVIVPKMLALIENRWGTKAKIPQLIMAGASVDDVFVIVLFTVFTGIATGDNFSAMSIINIPFAVVNGIILGLLAGWTLSKWFKKFHMRDSTKVIIILSISFLFVALEHSLKGTFPLSGLLAVMCMGSGILKFHDILASRLSQKFGKLWVAAEIILFVLVGATVDINFAIEAGLPALGVIFMGLLFRMAGVYFSLLGTPLKAKERLFCAIAYLPKATVQAAIASIPLAMGLPCGNIVLTVAVLSILITAPLGAIGIDTTYKKLLKQE
ncbi:MAG: cation:proton antiporter [Bacteroidetes bacterium]|nr:cation:proton antiporter [Bacteroidota bacterium]